MNLSENTPKCIWFTGLPSSGKTTISRMLKARFDEVGLPSVLLDGDPLRQGLNKGLGFAEADREENIRRAAELARLILSSGVNVICAFISPTNKIRGLAKGIIGKENFVEVFVDSPLETCIKRDPKKQYFKAQQGELINFTGIDAPYEAPDTPALKVETNKLTSEQCLLKVLQYLGGTLGGHKQTL